jgi:hypothetical protein
MGQRGITPVIRKAVLGEDGDVAWCEYCGWPATEVDHIVPRSRGGGLDWDNLAPACFDCNTEKNNRTPEEWAHHRRIAGKPWPIPPLDARIADLYGRGILPWPPEGSDMDGVREWMDADGRYAQHRRHLIAARNVPLGTYCVPGQGGGADT